MVLWRGYCYQMDQVHYVDETVDIDQSPELR
jgi:hypothetical protein